MISKDVLLSKFPVGSSARIIEGLFTRALPTATLWRCPPESWFGLWSILSASPTWVSTSVALIFLSLFEKPA